MPRNRYYRRRRPFRRRRRRYRKRRRTGVLTVSPYQMTPLAKSLKTTLRWSECITLLQAVTDVPQRYFFRASSIFQPDQTGGGGHQPMGTDQLFNLYQHACVLGSKITVKVVNTNASGSALVVLGLLAEVPTAGYDITRSAEQGHSKVVMVSDNAATPQKTITNTYSARKFFSVGDPNSDDKFKCSATSNPAENAFYELSVVNAFPAQNPINLIAYVEIEYYTQFSEPKVMSQS